MTTLADIERATLEFSTERQKLVEIVTELQSEMDALKRKRLAAIRRAVAATAEKKGTLENLLTEGKQLFTKPRSFILHGIRVGFQKGKGKLEWQDPERVADLVEKHLPKEFESLIETKHIPIADALSRLDAATLRRLGVNVIEADDQVVIRPTDSAVDKVVNALLKGADEVQEEKAA